MDRILRLLLIGTFALTFVATSGAQTPAPKRDCCGAFCPMQRSGPTPSCCQRAPAQPHIAVSGVSVPLVAYAAACSISLPVFSSPQRIVPAVSASPPNVLCEGPSGLSPPSAVLA
jgi:hypothetical protein